MSNNEQPKRKEKFHITILAYDDGSISIDAPTDFFLFREMMNAAERILLNKYAEQKRNMEQARILAPTLKQIIPMTGKN